jgi:hypothetical protein
MELLDYTDKSFVVIGENTKLFKDKLKELGGRYNPNLTHPETKEKMAAWIFSKKQKEKLQSFVQENPTISSIHSTGQESSDIIQEMVDPIQRLGLKDNGPDPPKRTRKQPFKSVNNENLCRPKANVSLSCDSPLTPEIQEIQSYSMIVPKIGMKVKLVNETKEELVLEIVETKMNQDGYVFDFKAKKDDIVVDFVMVGKEWRRISTEVPHSMNFI